MRLLANDLGPATFSTAKGLSSYGQVLDAADDLALGAVIPRSQTVTGAISFQVPFAQATTLKVFQFPVGPMSNNHEKSCNR